MSAAPVLQHASSPPPLRVAVIGCGLMGAFHAETLAHHLPNAHLAAVADAGPGIAEREAQRYGCQATADYRSVLDDPTVEAVVIAAPGPYHAEIVEAAAHAGKAIFCEKPIAHTLADADRALAAVTAAGVPLQIGFQRRFDPGFRQAHDLAREGRLGAIHLLRSTTRDPRLEHPDRIVRNAIFLETLIHDFDVLRWLSDGEAVEVYAVADALVAPDYRAAGLLDTAVVTIRFDNGALATADASFQAVYGYDVRAEVFGSQGMATVGDGRESTLVHYTEHGASTRRVNWFLDLFRDAYRDELAHFVQSVRAGTSPACTGADGRAALAIALAAARSAEIGCPVRLDEGTSHGNR